MANPAELLHEILTGWINDGTKSVHVQRGINYEESLMQKHRRAIGLINEIEQIVGGMDLNEQRQQSIQRNLARWTKWVFAYPHEWLSKPNPAYLNLQDQDALDALDFVAQLLENQVSEITDTQRDSYLETINQIITALGADDSLPSDLKKHVYTIAAHARQCIEEYELTGDFALQAAVERLAAAVQTAISISSDPSAWEKFKDKFFYPTLAGIVASGPQLAIAASTAL